ncbi:Putative Carbon-nitrogen family protein [[Torrubiella] hemipterigena]|uniref:Putative Carbon-nitrogen family protein n=1 Tax=[Torrubiella] hemipterigena TaxID=1531966 RepID=A0A0A1T6L4_9HYPO|nr:Putative Carbon-nitrogen family protein [[Torrubiella] hemipterigena]
MRIACLQFAPQVGDIENNLNRADAVLQKANTEDLDLLVLPELAFTGYNFKSLQDISPFLEPSGSGISSLWARTMALKYNCTVTVGYPEKVDVSPKWPTGPEFYNSTIVVNGDGETIANYRKSFLYHTDETWALEGPRGFFDGMIPGLGSTTIGICMDINPYKFEAPWNAFEFAFHILEVKSNLVIISMAWMTREEPRRFSRMPNEPDMDTLTYWVTRLEPLIRAESDEEIIVVFCNRTGIEDDATYAGTSAVIGIHEGEVKVYGLLGRGSKELLVVDTNDAPYAKLVHRPSLISNGGVVPVQKPIIPEGTAIQAGELEHTYERKNNGLPEEDPKPKSFGNETSSRDISRGRSPTRPVIPSAVPLPLSPPSANNDGHEKPKRKPAVPIIIPKSSQVSGDGMQSPGSVGVLTPSAPSPVPMMLRPKLIIPQSPPIDPQQFISDMPISALSQQSEQSIHSVRSLQSVKSDDSTQTVRSNPRPPEDSTPYPHSGMPLSGYPMKRRIYGGHVSIDTFSPTTPFTDISPISPQWQWKQPDSALRTPLSAGGWGPGTPVGRQPEPFPWPIITGKAAPHSRSGSIDVTGKASEAPSRITAKTPIDVPLTAIEDDNIMTAVEAPRVTENGTPLPARPSSPKSRNASRSRKHERSDSSLEQRDITAAVTQHLDDIAYRVRSASASRENATTSVHQTRQQSVSRNSSRAPTPGRQRATTPGTRVDERGAPIVPTPAAFDYYRQAVPLVKPQRSNSFSTTIGGQVFPSTPDRPGAVPRPPSRGRQPGPTHPSSSLEEPRRKERPTSADSTRNDVLHRRASKRGERSASNQKGRISSKSHQNRKPRGASRDQVQVFERVEAVLCPNCPVHGHRPESAHTVRDQGLIHNILLSQSGASEKRPENKAEYSTEDSGPATSKSDSQAVSQKTPTSVPGRSMTAPPLFNPSTPKAMIFDRDDVDCDLMLEEAVAVELQRAGYSERPNIYQVESRSETVAQ